MSVHRSLSVLVHGSAKAGKSWFGSTTPAPRLILDAEGGSRFTPGRKIIWNPISERPPECDGSWDTCLVYVHDFLTVLKAFEWLNSGQHCFESVTIDSISEVQQRCVDAIAGTDQMKTQDWGTLLRTVSSVIRQFRDLTTHPRKPLQAVVMIAMTREYDGKWKPYVQGQLATVLPYYVDLCGYLFVQQLEDGTSVRRLLCSPHPQFEAGERVGGALNDVVDNPNIVTMLDAVFGAPQQVEPVLEGSTQ